MVNADAMTARGGPILRPGAPVLVTGGLGFIGSALVRSLLADDHRVTVLDDGSGGYPDRLDDLSTDSRLEVCRTSVLDRSAVASLVERHGSIFHLAAVVGVRRVLLDPERTWQVNARGAAAVIDEAAAHDRPLVLFSSSEVYGPSCMGPLSEKCAVRMPSAAHPRWVYARAKRFAEEVALQRQRDRGLAVIVVRPFNVVGPGQLEDSGMVLPSFVGRALRGEPLLVHGDGRQRRVFLHVSDCVRAVRALAESPGAVGRIINVGGVHETSVADLAALVRRRTGSASAIHQVPFVDASGHPIPDFPERRPDLDLLRRLTGFEPRHDLDRMIRDAAAGCDLSLSCRAAT